jgi:hypothetical protein
MGRMKLAIETLRLRRADVRSTLERTDDVLLRARAAMLRAEQAIEKTENLVKRHSAMPK